MMNLAVIGCGRWGKNILRTLADLEKNNSFRLSEVVHQGNVERANWVRENLKVPCHTELDRALSTSDAVCLATPDDTHVSLTRKALQHDNHVFVEKPLAFDLDQARSLLARAARNELILMPGHLMVFHPVVNELESDSKFQLDRIDEITILRHNNLRDSGERRLLHSSVIHDITLLDRLFQKRPEEINVLDVDGPWPQGQYIFASLRYGSTRVRVEARSNWPFKNRQVVFRDETIFFRFDGIEESLERYDTEGDDGSGGTTTFDALPLTEELKHFIRRANGADMAQVSRGHTLRVMEVLEELESKARDLSTN